MSKSNVTNQQIKIKINGKEIKNTLADMGLEIGKLTKELRNLDKTDPQFKNKVAELKKAKEAYADLKNEIKGVPDFFDKMTLSVKGFYSALGLAVGVQTFVTSLSNAYSIVKDFDSAQSELAAILGKNKTEIAGLTALTLKLGATTAFTATQATQAATELAKLGFSVNEIKQSLGGIIDGAVALGSEIPETAELVAATLKAFGLQAQDTTRVVSVLAAGANATSLGFESLKTSLGNVAPAAAAANLSIEQTVALLGLITDNGIDASTAGTSLRNMLIKLADSGMPLQEALNQIADSQNQLTKATELFDVRSAVSAIALASQKDKVTELTDALTGQEAVLKQMAKTRLDNLEGSVTLFKSAWEGLVLSIEKGDGIIGSSIRNFVDLGTSLLNLITPVQGLSGELQEQQVQMNLLAIEVLRVSEKEEQRHEAIERLKSSYPEFLNYLSDENISNKQLMEALDKINAQYARKISIAKGQEELTRSLKNQKEATEELGKAQQKLLKTLLDISNTIPEIKVNFSAQDLATETQRVLDEMNKLGEGWSLNYSKLQRLSTKYVTAAHALNGYNKEVDEARTKNDRLVNAVEKQESAHLSTIITYNKASEVIEKYKNGLLTQGEAYFSLSKNQTASSAELLAFEKLVSNFSNTTLQSFITQLAKENMAVESSREVIKNAAVTYQSLRDAKNKYIALFPESVQKTKELKKSIEGLTLSEILEKTQLLERITYLDKNIQMNTLMGASLDALRGKYNETAKAGDDLSSINGVKSKINDLNAKYNSANTSEERSKLKKEIAELQKIEDELTGKAEEQRRKKAEESMKKAAQAAKKLEEKNNAERKKLQEAAKNEEEKFQKQLLTAERKYQDEHYSLLKNGYDKDLILLNVEYTRKKEDISNEIKSLEALSKEYEKKASIASKLGDRDTSDKFKKLAEEQVQIIQIKEETITALEKKHAAQRLKLIYDYRQKEIEKTKENYENEIRNLQIRYEEELSFITDLETAKSILLNYYDENEIKNLRTINEAKKKLIYAQEKELYEMQLEQLNELRTQLNDELQKNADNEYNGLDLIFTEEQLEEKKKQLNDVILLMNKIQSILTGKKVDKDKEDKEEKDKERSKILSGIDLLGFSGDEWENAFKNLDTWSGKLKAVTMSVQALHNVWDSLYQMQAAATQKSIKYYERETSRKKELLKNQLEQGYITQSQYDAKVQKLEEKMAEKRADLEYKSDLQKYRMDISNAISNTALGVTRALSSANFVLAALVAAQGGLQVGIITNNKPQKGYVDGGVTTGLGFTDNSGHEVAGIVHAKEYVIPEWLRHDPQIARLEKYIEYKRTGGKNSVEAGESTPSVPSAASQKYTDDLGVFLKENIALLQNLKNNGVIAYVSDDFKTTTHLIDRQKKVKEILNNAKIV